MKLDEVSQLLEARLEQLIGRISVIESELRSPGPDDSQDRATESENQEVLERLSESERQEVEQIRAALSRISQGTYSVCADCGSQIPRARLLALPYTSLCLQCAG